MVGGGDGGVGDVGGFGVVRDAPGACGGWFLALWKRVLAVTLALIPCLAVH